MTACDCENSRAPTDVLRHSERGPVVELGMASGLTFAPGYALGDSQTFVTDWALCDALGAVTPHPSAPSSSAESSAGATALATAGPASALATVS